MFKLVVLSALFAAVAAKPSGLYVSPYIAYSSVVRPATTTITKSASSVVHPSPIVYSSPVVYSTPLAYTHFIKKRSAQYLTYDYSPVSYLRSFPYAATSVVSSPFIRSSAIVPIAAPLGYSTAHLIKKRSAPVLVAPTTYASAFPLYAKTYATASVISTPLIHSTPLVHSPVAYSTHFIKKRSAPILTSYVAPTSYSHQSRVDVTHNAPVVKLSSYPTSFISQPYYY